MMDIQEHCMRYTGAKMDREVPPVTNGREIVISYHDECIHGMLESMRMVHLRS